MKSDIPDVHTDADPDVRPPTPGWDFPAHKTWFWCDGPQILARFPDGLEVEFRPGSGFPQVARVHGAGIDIKGLRLDLDLDVNPDGTPASILRPWKTGVNGVDGAEDVAGKYRDAALKLCRQRAADARGWLRTCLTGRQP